MEKILYPKLGWLGKAGIIFFGMLTIVLAGAGSWAGALGCALVAGLIVYQFLPGVAWLRLDEKGFTMRHFWRESTTPWTDVDSFVIITQRYMLIPIRRTVGYRFSKARQRNVIMKAVGFIARFDAQFPNNYGMKAKELAALLEAWRQKMAAQVQPEGHITVIR